MGGYSLCFCEQGMDGELYSKVRDAYSMYAQIELDATKFIKAEFEDLAEQAILVRAHDFRSLSLSCEAVY